MNQVIKEYLISLKNKTVSLEELSALFAGDTTYEEFASYIEELCAENILIPIKTRGRNYSNPSLFYFYRVDKYLLNKELMEQIQSLQLKVHKGISLSAYYGLSQERITEDLPYILKVDRFLTEKGFQLEEALSPERSFQLVADEKWIDEKGGRKLLERLKVWEALKISTTPDPLMYALNPAMLGSKVHRHLIVENKATFYGLSDAIRNTPFTTLVYGCGWKIAGSVQMLPKQLSMEEQTHTYDYFGDLDYEGMSIWLHVYEAVNAKPALPFYEALLRTNRAEGKTNQRKNLQALEQFLAFFQEEDQNKIQETLENGGYYPQETLTKDILQEIGRSAIWK
ncbi:Wadjet anti-phage system protein JetD domain-containing protein [Geosporobacter ferrireducens]|uniref:Wadjet protein JetD C-terminal domain-containing protein n=1 Tax=Geosporobacter ferrireducens TaxID=1424294 RepID=A0A1D8GN33_9FIRM|nr:Wadjet anti-phage system protein JetD domain-containing protein [Geosporobacter ferrireducens]AOT72320.1 hypothetical protein Gferi_23890 [Geosporobacter ferrireducens]